jgi:hypothetical protein
MVYCLQAGHWAELDSTTSSLLACSQFRGCRRVSSAHRRLIHCHSYPGSHGDKSSFLIRSILPSLSYRLKSTSSSFSRSYPPSCHAAMDQYYSWLYHAEPEPLPCTSFSFCRCFITFEIMRTDNCFLQARTLCQNKNTTSTCNVFCAARIPSSLMSRTS